MEKFIVILLIQSCIFFTNGEILKIEITHWGDVNGQIESFLGNSLFSSSVPEPCPNGDLTCLGGVVSLAHYIHAPLAINVSQSLRLSSGNLIGGKSGWIPSIGWTQYAEFVRDHFKPDVMTLGMNEFAAGLSKTIQYMDAINKFSTYEKDIHDRMNIVIANTCQEAHGNDTSEYEFCRRISKMKAIPVGSSQIGVIGFVTPTVEQLSSPGKLKFGNVPMEIQEVISDNPDVKTFIAIGDGDLKMAKEIIDQNAQVRLVIYSEGFTSSEKTAGNSLISYKNSFIATTGQHGSSIQRLILDWDTTTEHFTINNASKVIVTRRPEILNKIGLEANSAYSTQFIVAVDRDKNNVLGHSRVPLQGGEKCWREECNLGNLVTDAMVHCAIVQPPVSQPFPYPLHSIWYGGALFKDTVKSGVHISKFDIHKWLPHPIWDRSHLVKVIGSNLRRVFEASAGGIDPEKADQNDWGQFLQVSKTIQVYYDAISVAPKLTKLRMTHLDKSGMPQFADIQDSREYYLVIPTYLYEGRGVYEFANFWKDVTHANISSDFASDVDCVANYTTALREISIGYEDRIIINRDADNTADSNWKKNSMAFTIFLVTISSVSLSSFIIPH